MIGYNTSNIKLDNKWEFASCFLEPIDDCRRHKFFAAIGHSESLLETVDARTTRTPPSVHAADASHCYARNVLAGRGSGEARRPTSVHERMNQP